MMAESERETPMRMMKNLLCLFVVVFVSLTALDLATTWFGLQKGFVETNPYSDTSSIRALVVPEVVVLAIGCLFICFGVLWKRKKLATVSNGEFKVFYSFIFNVREWPAPLFILLPIVVALGRVVPVVNNSMYLLLGWSITGSTAYSISQALGWSAFQANALINSVLFILLLRPTIYVMHRVCRSSVYR